MRLELFNERLLAIGGRHTNGMPRLRVVSAKTETKFACGGIKVKYPAGSKTEERWLWGLRDKATGKVTAKSQEDVNANTDPEKQVVKKLLNRTVTWFGRDNYVVEYYRPVEDMKDTPLNWWQNRYAWWHNPESGLTEWTDMNGEFPFNGRYDLLLIVKEEDGTVWGKFRELDQDVLNEVEKAVAAHRSFKKVLTDEESIRHMYEEAEAKEDRFAAQIADEVEQDFGADWRRMVQNNPEALVNEIARLNRIEEQKI